ncbi:LysR family transcriptional regulator [Microbacterium sp. NPDC055683]
MAGGLDVDQLRTFVAIDDLGGFGRAADALGLSQPTVSQHVRRLEGAIGRPLVRRSGRGSALTADGRRLLVEARRILAVHDDALERLAVARPRTLVVGTAEVLPAAALRVLAEGLRDAHPDIDLVVRVEPTAHLLGRIGHEVVDLAVLLDVDDAVAGRAIGRLPLRWVGHVDTARASGVRLVGYDETPGLRQKALRLLADAGRPVEMSAEAASLGGVVEALRAGLGVALVPDAGGDGLPSAPGLPEPGDAVVRLSGRLAHEGGIADTVAALLGAVLLRLSAGGPPRPA